MKVKHLLLTLLICLVSAPTLRAQTDSIQLAKNGLVRWMSLQEAEEQNKQFPKAVMIFVDTDWCGWCKHMIKTTFSNPGIAAYINLNFYPVRFNAESKDTVVFQGRTYTNQSTGNRPPHDLAKILLSDKLTYPTLVFYNDNWQFKLIVPGFKEIRDLEPILIYTTEYVFKTSGIEKFIEIYNKSIPNDTNTVANDTLHWLSIEEAVSLNESAPKKIMVMIGTSWCHSGRAMKNGTFRDSLIVKICRDYFYPVYFDAEWKDTITFKGITFANSGKTGTFHDFAISLCNGQLTLPTLIYIDSNYDLISAVPQFYPPDDMEYVLNYFGGDSYKTQTWEEFKKAFIPARNQGTEHEFKF